MSAAEADVSRVSSWSPRAAETRLGLFAVAGTGWSVISACMIVALAVAERRAARRARGSGTRHPRQAAMVPLSTRTREHLIFLFRDGEQANAERLLVGLEGDASPSARTPESLERLRFAALRVSGGTLTGLRGALDLATTD